MYWLSSAAATERWRDAAWAWSSRSTMNRCGKSLIETRYAVAFIAGDGDGARRPAGERDGQPERGEDEGCNGRDRSIGVAV